MEADEQGLITRLRSFLNVVLSSKSTTPETYTWCQLALPGSCYLSCATSTGTGSFATTSNLIARGEFQISLIPTQNSRASHSLQGAVLHNSWPPRHPELLRLRQNVPWDSVLAVSIPLADSPAPAAGTTAAATAAAARADAETSPGHFHNRSSSTDPVSASEDWPKQTEAAQYSAESVLILGLRGQRLDLERALVKLQMLAHQLTSVMHDHRQQLIDQAMHAASTAHAAATAVSNGDMPDAHMATASSVSSDATDSADDTGATALVTAATAEAAAGDLAAPVLTSAPSPFAASEGPVIPNFPGGIERQGRRREQSGTLRLDQILSRSPSPMSSNPSQSLDRYFLDGLSRQSSAQPSRLSSDSLREISASGHFVPTASPAPTAGQLPQNVSRQSSAQPSRLSSDSLREGSASVPTASPAPFAGQLPQEDLAAGHNSAVATAAPPEILATVFSGQGLPSDSPSSSLEPSASPQAEDSESEPCSSRPPQAQNPEAEQGSSEPHRSGKRKMLVAADEIVGDAATAAVTADIHPGHESAEPKDADALAQLKSEAEASHQGRRQQHPWLLYFYDEDMERDYSRYHARQMLKDKAKAEKLRGRWLAAFAVDLEGKKPFCTGSGREKALCSGSGREKTILQWIWKEESIWQWIWKGKNVLHSRRVCVVFFGGGGGIGLLHMAHPDGCWLTVTFLPRPRPYPVRGHQLL
ncbi:TPA: hypothetical protein ACH3X2_007657 [Trebouxia sp. C0005]